MRHAFFALLFALPFFGGCSSSKTASGAPPVDAGVDAAADLVEGCTSFVDRRDPSAERTLLWDQSIAVDDSRCLQVKVGQAVTWGNGLGGPGDFKMHPLIAFEGDDNNPIQNLDYQTGAVTFDTPGTFGFVCGTHPAMKGAVMVTAQ